MIGRTYIFIALITAASSIYESEQLPPEELKHFLDLADQEYMKSFVKDQHG